MKEKIIYCIGIIILFLFLISWLFIPNTFIQIVIVICGVGLWGLLNSLFLK